MVSIGRKFRGLLWPIVYIQAISLKVLNNGSMIYIKDLAEQYLKSGSSMNFFEYYAIHVAQNEGVIIQDNRTSGDKSLDRLTEKVVGISDFFSNLDKEETWANLFQGMFLTAVNPMTALGAIGGFMIGGPLGVAVGLSITSFGADVHKVDIEYDGDFVSFIDAQGGLEEYLLNKTVDVAFDTGAALLTGYLVKKGMSIIDDALKNNKYQSWYDNMDTDQQAYRDLIDQQIQDGWTAEDRYNYQVYGNKSGQPWDGDLPPNGGSSGGRLGNSDTRAELSEGANLFADNGYEIVGGGGRVKEEYLPGNVKGSTSGGNYVDLTVTKEGKTIRINTVDTYSDGVTPTSREQNAANLINSKVQDPIILIPKGTLVKRIPELIR